MSFPTESLGSPATFRADRAHGTALCIKAMAMLGSRISLAALALGLAGCATSSYQVVHLPQRNADLYPLAQAKEGVTIAIDEIKEPERAKRYFGADLIKAGIVPVTVVISNKGAHRLKVKSSDVVLHRAKEIVDPLPLELVVATAKRQHGRLRPDTEAQVDAYFSDVAFRETILPPNATYQGTLFFPTPPKKQGDKFFVDFELFRQGGPSVIVGVTTLEAGDRLHFGPFPVSLAENASLLSNVSY
jgi:hypothetical protein